MEILLIWGSTIIASIGMQTIYELKLFKDVADSGYKIDIEKLSNNKANSDSNTKFKIATLSNLIPIYNIMLVLFKVATYNKEYIFRSLDSSNAIIPLTDEEYNEYNQKPTGLRALKLSLKTEEDYNLAFKLTTYEGDNMGDIYFKLDNEKIEINVVKLTGIAKTFTPERQNAEVLKHLLIHQAIGDDKFIDYDIDSFNSKYSDSDVTIKEEYSNENLKQELEAFRNFLIENKEKDNNYQYTKRK